MGERVFLRGRAGGKYGRAAAGACAAYFKRTRKLADERVSSDALFPCASDLIP